MTNQSKVGKTVQWKAHDRPKAEIIKELGYNVKFGENVYKIRVLSGNFAGGEVPVKESRLRFIEEGKQ